MVDLNSSESEKTSSIYLLIKSQRLESENTDDRLVKQLKEQQGITEQLKADDMMAWVQAMNNISNQARKIVNAEVIYSV